MLHVWVVEAVLGIILFVFVIKVIQLWVAKQIICLAILLNDCHSSLDMAELRWLIDLPQLAWIQYAPIL